MNNFKISFLLLFGSILLTSSSLESVVPAPQSLIVTLTGYRDADNSLKCKLYYMMTLPQDASIIKNIHLTLEKPVGDDETEYVTDIIVPFDWAEAQKIDGVVSFYNTRNILYIGIGEYELLRRYQCKAAFISESGEKSRYAIFKK